MARTIRLENIRKEYKSKGKTHIAVDGINLNIPKGSFTTIVGPSGCGKTTTLRLISGLEKPTSGKILFDEEDVTDLAPQQRNIGMVFQNIALYPHMTVQENIGYGLKIKGTGERERRKRIEAAADTLQIRSQLEKMPGELSGGQQQRVALGRIFVEKPDVLLLDEPMSDLDAKLKAELRVEVQKLHQELDTTLVYVTHDQTEAMTMSDYIAVFNSGRLEQFDPPTDLFSNPVSEYVATFIGTPATNILRCGVKKENAGLIIEGHGLEIPLPNLEPKDTIGNEVKIGIRPQYLSLSSGEYSIELNVNIIEPLGTRFVVHSETTEGTPVDVVTNKGDELREGQRITAGFDQEDLFIFNAEGETIMVGKSPTKQPGLFD